MNTVAINKESQRDYDDDMNALMHSFDDILHPDMAVIVRIEGRHFKKFTSNLASPHSESIQDALEQVADLLVMQVKSARLAYVCGDQIHLLMLPAGRSTEMYGNGFSQLISSDLASVTTMKFNEVYQGVSTELVTFRAVCFCVTTDEAQNYLNWCQRKHLSSFIRKVAAGYFGDAAIKHVNNEKLQEKLQFDHSVDLDFDFPTSARKGSVVRTTPIDTSDLVVDIEENKTIRKFRMLDTSIPFFSQDPDYVGRYLEVSPFPGKQR